MASHGNKPQGEALRHAMCSMPIWRILQEELIVVMNLL